MKVFRVRSRRVFGFTAVALMSAAVLFPHVMLGSIEEQRARLPPPATCQDPVEGVWMARVWHLGTEWYIYTLEIHRAAAGQPGLTGVIHSRFWDGPANIIEPPPCRPGHLDRTVFMTAAGQANGLDVSFTGTTWRPEAVTCGSPNAASYIRYNLDSFSGRIDPALQEFQSVNNDGGEAINEPTVFRRIRCFDSPSGPQQRGPVQVVAPPMVPEVRSGCSRSTR